MPLPLNLRQPLVVLPSNSSFQPSFFSFSVSVFCLASAASAARAAGSDAPPPPVPTRSAANKPAGAIFHRVLHMAFPPSSTTREPGNKKHVQAQSWHGFAAVVQIIPRGAEKCQTILGR